MISSIDSTAPDPSVVRNIPTPPFVWLPHPPQSSLPRAARLTTLADPAVENVATLARDPPVRASDSKRDGLNPFHIGH